ncbi:MAG: hypothetical protein ABJG41_13215 [Cyclobacteriaceae bacterium]
MKKLKKTELIILVVIWSMSLFTYPIALLNNYDLYASDYLGLAGLTIVTLIVYFKPEKSFQSVLILLLLGLFNLLSFAYFINIIITFGFSFIVTPGIQLISLVLISILVIIKRDKTVEFYREVFGQTEEEKEQLERNTQDRFKRKFEQLSDKEIESKLQQDLVPEAIAALNEIKEGRKKALQQGE